MAESKKQQVVTAPLVIAKRTDGSDVYLYQGARLPDGLADGEAKRLVDFLGSQDEVAEASTDAAAAASR